MKCLLDPEDRLLCNISGIHGGYTAADITSFLRTVTGDDDFFKGGDVFDKGYIYGATVAYGNFLATLLDFAIIAAVVYLGVKILGLDRLDKKKDDKK